MNIFEEAKKLANQRYNRAKLLSTTGNLITRFRFSSQDKPRLQLACGRLADALDRLSGSTLQQTVERFREEDLDAVEGWHWSPKLTLDVGRTGACPHAHGRSVD